MGDKRICITEIIKGSLCDILILKKSEYVISDNKLKRRFEKTIKSNNKS